MIAYINVTVTNSPDPIVIQALGSVASLVEEPCAPEKKMENGSHSASVFSSETLSYPPV